MWRSEQVPPPPRSPVLSSTRAESPDENWSEMTEITEAIVSLLDIPGSGQIIPSDVCGARVQERLR